MFKKSKGKVLIDYASEEEDASLNHRCNLKYKDPDGKQEVTNPESKSRVKKIKSKSEKNDKKLLFTDEDEPFLFTSVFPEKRSNTKTKDIERNRTYIEKGQCLWSSITMSMKQIAPTKKMDKMVGWEPPCVTEATDTLDDASLCAATQPGKCSSWTDLEEDLSKYSALIDPQTPNVRWATRAKGRLAVIRRQGRGCGSERWEGLK